MPRKSAALALFMCLATSLLQAANWPTPREGDYSIRNFKFTSGETLPELRIHYRTLGALHRDANGRADNAVLVMHGTGGTGKQFLQDRFAGELFGAGQPLDAATHFIVLVDDIGHGQSSKPSDGLRMKFPHYTYDDMLAAEHEVLTKQLGVDHLRLVMGTSMGGMHTWMWGERWPDFMDALMPLASVPVRIAGRNRVMRRMFMDAIRNDPEWNGGNYERQPRGLADAIHILMLMGSSPLQMQKELPTPESADRWLAETIAARVRDTDANDALYCFDASRDYDPQPRLASITAPLLAVNSADDEINPPELGILEREIRNVARGRAVVIPTSDATHGHSTHTWAAVWKDLLVQLLRESEPRH